MTRLFTKLSHHCRISVIFMVQNLFYRGLRSMRTLNLNAHYTFLFKSVRDKQVRFRFTLLYPSFFTPSFFYPSLPFLLFQAIRTIAQQAYPNNSKYFLSAYLQATAKDYGYLLFDATATCSDMLRLRTDIFRENKRTIVFVPRRRMIKRR